MTNRININQILYAGRDAILARAEVNHFVVNEYAELRKGGVKMPPVVLFNVDGDFFLVDGRHRIEAALANGEKRIECIVHEGELSAARAFAAGANVDHGLRRTNADKLACVKLLLADETWKTRSDNLIAIQCGVSHPFVAKVRGQLETVTSCEPTEPVKRIGKDLKARKVKAKKKASSETTATISQDELVSQSLALVDKLRNRNPEDVPAALRNVKRLAVTIANVDDAGIAALAEETAAVLAGMKSDSLLNTVPNVRKAIDKIESRLSALDRAVKHDEATISAAKKLGVSPAAVTKASAILHSGRDEVIDAVTSGRMDLDEAMRKIVDADDVDHDEHQNDDDVAVDDEPTVEDPVISRRQNVVAVKERVRQIFRGIPDDEQLDAIAAARAELDRIEARIGAEVTA
jgi:hypothetical protein